MTLRTPTTAVLLLALAGTLALAARIASGQEESAEPGEGAGALRQEMQSLAEATEVQLPESDALAQLVSKPVFRYDDQPRKFIDATMWIWTDGERPVACQKVEARLHQSTLQPQWGYCFTSLTAEKLAVRWSADRQWESQEAGVAFEPLPSAPRPDARDRQRKLQARELARQFSGRVLIDPRTKSSAEMRLLPRPIYEYADPQSEVLRGAVFGFETNGTNPDLLVLLEVRGNAGAEAWHFAPARMTTGGITLDHSEKTVWTAPFVSPHDGPFATWLFFSTERESPGDENSEAGP